MSIDELNVVLAREFPEEKLAQWRIEFSGFKATNPFGKQYERNPLKWKLCSAQFVAYAPIGNPLAFETTVTMSELALKDPANMEKVIGMLDLYKQYLKHMLAAEGVHEKLGLKE